MKFFAYHTSTVHSSSSASVLVDFFTWYGWRKILVPCEDVSELCIFVTKEKRSRWIVSESQQTGGWQIDKPVAEVERCE